MSDNKTPEPEFGEPVEEPTAPDNVVDRANEALADAQAARGDDAVPDVATEVSAAEPAPSAEAPAPAEAQAPAEVPAPADDEPDWSVLDDELANMPAPEARPADTSVTATHADPAPAEADAAPVADAARGGSTPWYDQPEVTESTSQLPESVKTVTELTPPPAAIEEEDEVLTGRAPAQPIFVQAPEPPLVRGNRGAAGLIGLLATLVFAILYLAARLLFSGINVIDPQALLNETIAQVSSFAFWTPVVVFFLAFWLLGAFINRGRWGYWVIFGLLVGLAAWAGHAAGAVIQAGPWDIDTVEANRIFTSELITPSAIAALLIGRELPIWFGAWLAARGRRMTVLNNEAQEEYERTLEAGPKLAHTS